MGKFKLKMDNMRRNYEMQERDGDYFKVPNGDSIVYIHPPCRTEEQIKAEVDFYTNKKMNKDKRQAYIDVLNLFDGVNFLEVYVHFGVGKSGRMVVCLDESNNPVLNHPIFQKYLRKKGIKLKDGCPICSAIENGEFDDEQMDSAKLQKRYIFGVTPIKTREKPSKDWVKIPPSPTVLWAGKTIYDGIMDLFFESDDITDPEETIYAKINRKGKGKFDTKYKIVADTASLRKPKKLSKKFVELVEKAMDGGSADLYKIIADSTMSYDEIVASMSGFKVEKSRDDDEDEPEDDEDEGEDERDDIEEEEGEKDEPEDDDDEEEEVEVDDEEDDDEEDEDEEDEEDEDEEEEDEPEPEPKKKSTRKKPPKKEKAKRGNQKKVVRAKEEEVDEDEEDLDELDAELERIKKRTKSKASTKTRKRK